MPSTPHLEQHFTSSAVIRDVVIGMADGLTVPFALAAGLTGAVDASRIIVVAGLAEIAAGSIAMGLGGYLAARSDAEHYANERKREEWEVIERNEDEVQEVHAVFSEYGLTEEDLDQSFDVGHYLQGGQMRLRDVIQNLQPGAPRRESLP